MPQSRSHATGDPSRPALSPEAAALLRARNQAGVRSHRRPQRLSRRGLLAGALGAGALLAGGAGVAALRQPPGDPVPVAGGCRAVDLSSSENTLVFANWPQYLDADPGDESRRPTLENFTKQTGIRVSYQEEINDNTEYLNLIKEPLAACRPTGRDLIVLTDWAAARLIREHRVQKFDLARLPNVEANLLPNLRIRNWDPTGAYAIPWQSGLTGIAYNGRVTKPVRTVDELLTRSDLKGRVTVLYEMADTMGLLLQAQGYNANNFTAAHFDVALEMLRKAVVSGQIVAATGNEYSQGLGKGKIAACIGWSGDVVQLRFDDESIEFVVPDSGAMLFSDNLQVPVKAAHKAHAERLVNYYYEPAVAAEVAAYVNYICPVAGAHLELEKTDPVLAADRLIFPDESMLAKTRIFMGLSAEDAARYQAKFQAVIDLLDT